MSSIHNIAGEIQQQYMLRFTKEFLENKQMLTKRNGREAHSKQLWRIITDYELDIYDKKENTILKFQISNDPIKRLYRQDFAIVRGTKLMDDFMCWPLIDSIHEEYIKEDIFFFPVNRDLIHDTEIEINPFPWFICLMEFYPNADAVKGLLDLWFLKWYYPRGKRPDPFLNVIHMLDGPYKEKDSCELYQIDFGTAPPEAFTDLINIVCRNGVDKIVVK